MKGKRKRYQTLKQYIRKRTAIIRFKVTAIPLTNNVGFYIFDREGNLYGKSK